LARDQRVGFKVGGAWRFPVADVIALRERKLK
jgi:hypothetical protein